MSRSGVCGGFFYIAYNTCIYSHSILSNVYYLIISRKHFHINIYIYTFKYIFFISLCTPTNWITTYTLLPSHLFPIKKASYLYQLTCFRCYGPKRPSAELSWKSRLFVWHDMGFFLFLRTQKFRHILPYCINLVHLYSTFPLKFNPEVICHEHRHMLLAPSFTALVGHIEQLHVHNYVRIYD